MTNLETYFKNSQPLNEYIDGMKTNQDTQYLSIIS